MGEAMQIDEVVVKEVKKPMKRKRAGLSECASAEEREIMVRGLEEEMEGLMRYFKEVMAAKVEGLSDLAECGTMMASSGMIACLLEESDLPLGKLVEWIFERLKGKDGVSLTTPAAVKSSVVMLGQRIGYGVVGEDADVLEDEQEECLWCWEARDLKMLPKSARVMLKVRRSCRKKIQERITAIAGLLAALRNPESDSITKTDLTRRLEKLSKLLNEADIRLLVDSMIQKNGAERSQKEAMKEEKLIVKQLEKSKRELEKEKKRVDREKQKEKSLQEKELKRVEEDAERRREREEAELRKQQKRLQEEAEKEQRRREKEDAELKRQIALKKQASLMERFLKKRKTDCNIQNDQSTTEASTIDPSTTSCQPVPESVIQYMDNALAQGIDLSEHDPQKSHMISWRQLGQSMRSNRKQHWGLRRKPKSELIKEIKLSNTRDIDCDNESRELKLSKGSEETEDIVNSNADDKSIHVNQKSHRRKQLLQFDKSFRPAFYGFWPKTSKVVGPRHPFIKDPELDYDVDSDEEWEEEDPGESLSDCDKDEEDESLETGSMKGEEDESEDGFFVPDGYLSESEGAQDRLESDSSAEDIVSTSCQVEDSEEIRMMFRHQKHMQSLTDQALRKNQPIFILNLMHEKAPLLEADDLSGIQKVEQICLKTLSMCLFPGQSAIEISLPNESHHENMESCSPNSKSNAMTKAAETVISNADLPKFVSLIQSGSQCMTRIIEGLQQNFPGVPKTQLKAKVRQLSDFVDNRWQVKKEVLDNLGLSPSPVKETVAKKPVAEKGSSKKKKTIASFFSKRCLPPSGSTAINSIEVFPLAPQKMALPADLQIQPCLLSTTDDP